MVVKLRRRGWGGIGVLALFFLAPALGAQDRLESSELVGRVTDIANGAPVEGALVLLEIGPGPTTGGAFAPGAGWRALTGPDGRFRLRAVPSGLLVVRIEHIAYGVHRQPLRVEGEGAGGVEIALSPTAIVLEPLIVEADASADLAGRASPSARNVIARDAIARAAASGMTLGDFLSREVSGMYVRRSAQVGGSVCLEFRGARRGVGPCRPPEVYVDGAAVPNPQDFFGYFSMDGLERIQVVSPSEAGTRFGPNSAWGVILLETRRTGLDALAEIPLVRRRPAATGRVDWSYEPASYPWARVYSGAFVGNALGLVAGAALLRRCMDLETRRFYRGPDACGAGPLLASGVAMTMLPALGGAFAAGLAGATPRSKGRLGRSILYSVPVFVPGFAIASVNAGGGGLGGAEIVGLVMVVLGGPALNTLADYLFRELR